MKAAEDTFAMGAVRIVVLTLGIAQQGERPLRSQRGPG